MLLDFTASSQQTNRCTAPEPLPQSQKGALMSYHSAGDDCAINELLEGRMDLDVVLPDGRKVKLTVERRTPMMDLLVQAASATKISPAGHTIHVFSDDGKGGTLPYKPSTPIGSLDANTICIVSKKDSLDAVARRNRAPARPFEPTFRVQVHLPRNQLTVVRVSPRSRVSELRDMVCREKGLDTAKYQLVRPTSRGQALDGAMTLSEYGATEIALLSNSCIESYICNSTSHIIPYTKRIEEQKKKTGILRLLAEDSSQKAQKKEATPSAPKAAPQPLPPRFKPKKRRPAPPPPPPEPAPFHSRQSSSDSSGYHEATSSSLLHHPHHEGEEEAEKAASDSSGVSSLDAKVAEVKAAKKRKAPPPPTDDHVNETEDLAPPVPDPVPSLENQKANLPLSREECTAEESAEEVTRVALAALSARLEQDVTQREIACSIQAAFHSLDGGEQRPSLLAIKQRSADTPLDQQQTQQQPPGCSKQTTCEEAPSSAADVKQPTDNRTVVVVERRGHARVEGPSEPSVTALEVPDEPVVKVAGASSAKKSVVVDKPPVSSSSAKRVVADNLVETECVAPPTVPSQELPARHLAAKSVTKQPVVHRPYDRSTKVDTDNKRNSVNLQNGSSEGGEPPSVHTTGTTSRQNGSTLLTRRSSNPEPSREPNGRHVILSTDAPSRGRKVDAPSYPLQKSTARLNFDDDEDLEQSFPPPPSQFRNNPDCKVTDDPPIPCPPNFRSTPLRRSSSLLNLSDSSPAAPPPSNRSSKRSSGSRNLQRSLSDLSTPGDDPGAEFEKEQQRLQREYLKLQRQFVLWQQQLLSNHAMLREERIVPQFARTLRQSHSLPEGGDEGDRGSAPLVSRSLSYEPSTLPRSAINIPPLEFGSGKNVTNGSNTLRSSKTKSYFKPPQVRVSTKNRQRLPPEIRKDGDMDLYDDAKILSTILPSFDSLKLISEDSADHLDLGNLILKPTGKVEKKTTTTPSVEVQKPSFFFNNNIESKITTSDNIESKITTTNNIDSKKITTNNNIELKKIITNNIESKKIITTNNIESKKITNTNNKVEGSLKKVPPPVPNKTSTLPKVVDAMTKLNNERNNREAAENVPPPPPPPPSLNAAKVNGVVSKRVVEKKVVTPQVDPREQLMQEIRKCGGRTALRKISLDIPS